MERFAQHAYLINEKIQQDDLHDSPKVISLVSQRELEADLLSFQRFFTPPVKMIKIYLNYIIGYSLIAGLLLPEYYFILFQNCNSQLFVRLCQNRWTGIK